MRPKMLYYQHTLVSQISAPVVSGHSPKMPCGRAAVTDVVRPLVG